MSDEHKVMCYWCHKEYRPVLSQIKLVCNDCYEGLISEILKEIKACKCGIGYNEYKIDDLIKKLEGKLK